MGLIKKIFGRKDKASEGKMSASQPMDQSTVNHYSYGSVDQYLRSKSYEEVYSDANISSFGDYMTKLHTMNRHEMMNAIIPHPITKHLVKQRVKSPSMAHTNVGVYPKNTNPNEIPLSKCVSFIPYCSKPHNCPLNNPTRKNTYCLALNKKECPIPCSIGDLIPVLYKHGFTKDRIYLIDADSNLFKWLGEKKSEGYSHYLPGLGCFYGVSYALSIIEKSFGFTGVVGFIDERKDEAGMCKSIRDYTGMEGQDKGKKTVIRSDTITQIDELLSSHPDSPVNLSL